jgi:putative transposase
MYVNRTETIKLIKSKDPLFKIIDDLAFKSKNVYNSALYICKQQYFSTKNIISYTNLEKLHKTSYTQDYKALPAQTVQQIIKTTQEMMQSFYQASKEYTVNPNKFKARPRLPRYKHKTKGRYTLIFTNQQAKYKIINSQGYISFPKAANIPDIKTRLDLKPETDIFCFTDKPLCQVRIVPLLNSYRIDVIYNKEINTQSSQNTDSSKIHGFLSIDLGINNFLAIVTYKPQNNESIILNGKGIKYYNKYFNKKLSTMKSHLKSTTDNDSSKSISALYEKRNRVYKDFYHKASRFIVDYCLDNNINYIVVGYNKDWKTNSQLSKKVNQTFIQLGYSTFISMLRYKCKESDIHLILQEESYTSGTSFLDKETPDKQNYNKSRRVHRGLFRHNNQDFKTSYINADINAAYQILVKATNSTLYYRKDIITQSSIEPTVINLDTFKIKTKSSNRNKYTLKQEKVS